MFEGVDSYGHALEHLLAGQNRGKVILRVFGQPLSDRGKL
jgi:hypothetical protein